MAPTIHVVPKTPPAHCPQCARLITDPWEPGQPLCATCALDAELFDKEARLGRDT